MIAFLHDRLIDIRRWDWFDWMCAFAIAGLSLHVLVLLMLIFNLIVSVI